MNASAFGTPWVRTMASIDITGPSQCCPAATAATVVAAALDASIAREGRKRLAELLPPAQGSG